MKSLKNKINKLFNNNVGATLIEYAALVALVAIVGIAAYRYISSEVNNSFSSVAEGFE